KVLQRVRDVIRDTDTPSWLPSVPYNFGSSSAGNLKADEWRTLTTVYFPISLRLIGQIQRIPHNHLFGGQLESTMFTAFTRATSLRRWIARPDCPPFLRECQTLFAKTFGGAVTDLDSLDDEIAQSAFSSTPLELKTIISEPSVYSPSLSSDLSLVQPTWVLSHYARWKLDEDRVVVLTLSRVSPFHAKLRRLTEQATKL
ncbi:hypothetical protein HYPSUDRAFT_150821, partial [Hypholoma sublateritium FD-334 SS-4]